MSEEKEFNEDLFGFDLSNMEEMTSFMEQTTGDDTPKKEESEVPDVESEEEIEDSSSKPTGEEEEEEQEEQEKIEEKEGPSSQETDDSSPLTPYAKLLVEEGLLPNSFDFEKWDGSAEGLLEAKREYDIEQFEQFKTASLDPRVKWLQDNLEEGVKLEDLLKLDAEKIELQSITEENIESDIEVAKNVAKMFFKKTSKWSDTMIDKSVERLESVGELQEESKTFLKQLNEILQQEEQQKVLEAQNEIKAAEEAERKMLENFRSTLDQTNEIIAGLKVTPTMKDKIFSALTTQTSVDQQTQTPLNRITEARTKDPIGFDIKLAYLFELTNGFSDWSSISKGGRKQAYDEFEKQAKAADIKSTRGGQKQKISRQQQTSADVLKELEFISRQMGQ